MKLLLGKILLYALLIFIVLELIVRLFHLYQEYPEFIINDKNVKTYTPNQDGFYVTGNRRMNFSKYHINQSGFNSYREFNPTKENIEIALIGDSFIEGLHQNYYNSIGHKIEKDLHHSVKVFEYGHVGYDFADQLYLIQAYKEKFELIDFIIIYLKFENDFTRDHYEPDKYWIDSQYFTFSKIKRNIKLLQYIAKIGGFEAARKLKAKIISGGKNTFKKQQTSITESKNIKYLDNFKKLIEVYGINKRKTFFLLDSSKTPKIFLNYCNQLGYRYIDFGKYFKNIQTPTNLIYDKHWNNSGREIVAKSISDFIVNYK